MAPVVEILVPRLAMKKLIHADISRKTQNGKYITQGDVPRLYRDATDKVADL